MSPQTLDIIAAVQRAIKESGIDMTNLMSDEWDDAASANMDALSESARWNTIAMYLELPDDEAEKWPPKVVGRLFKIWEKHGWLAARDEMMRMTSGEV